MNRFMLVIAAFAVCGPFAANAAVSSAPVPQGVITNSVGTAGQDADINREVMALNNEVQSLEQQNGGAIYAPQLQGIIPTGG